MFQVASYPSSFEKVAYGHHSHQPITPSPLNPSAVQLPRQLTRPQFVEVSQDALLSASPDLAQFPPEYIRRALVAQAPAMLAGISASKIPTALHKSEVPPCMVIHVRSTSHSQLQYPTHVLAISQSKSSDTTAHLFPIHGIILASHCTSLPRLPPSRPSQPVQLPVLPLTLPSLAAFKVLHSYMYAKRLDSVLKALFPCPPSVDSLSHETVRATLTSSGALHQLSCFLYSANSGNLRNLTACATRVKELWQDMVALGLFDPQLWDALDLAWEVVLGALNMAAKA